MSVVPFAKPETALLRRALQVQQQKAGLWVEAAAHASILAAHSKRQGNFKPSLLEMLHAQAEKLDDDLRHFETLQAGLKGQNPGFEAALTPVGRSLSRSSILMLESLAILEGMSQSDPDVPGD